MGLGAAVVGAGVLGAGASIYGASKASKAAGNAATAQSQAAAAANAEQQREFDIIQANNAPNRALGQAASGAVASAFGLPVSMTGAPAASAAAPGVSMTGGKSSATPNTFPAVPDVGASAYAPAASPPAAGGALTPDQIAQIVKDRPDVLAAARANPAGGSVEDNINHWYSGGKQAAGDTYQLPTAAAPTPTPTPAPTPTASGYTPPPGYTDPTATNGYTMTAPRPAAVTYTAPPLDVSAGAYTKSPDYNFRLQQGQDSLDHLAAAGGGLMSGARVKAATRYGEDYATTNYDDWRNYTTGQYNTNRSFDYTQAQNTTARNDGLYQDDRSNLNTRYDTRNNTLLQLAGFGNAATASDNAAAQSYATNVGNNLMTSGNAKASGYINQANITNQAVGNIANLAGNTATRLMTAGGYGGGYGANGGYGGTISPELAGLY